MAYHHHSEEKQSEAAKVEEADQVETLEQKLMKTNRVFQISPITKVKKLKLNK